MKRYGLILAVFLVGCTSLHRNWLATSATMKDVDSVTLSRIMEDSLVYSFHKDGTYTYKLGWMEGAGTYLYRRGSDSIWTTESGKTDAYGIRLDRDDMTLFSGVDTLYFIEIDY